MARDVFISYKREDRAVVERIAERLRGLGLDVWFDSKLSSGLSYDEEINREVRAAKCVLVCWTPAAIESDFVRAEATIGRQRDVLAAVFLQPTDLYPPFNLVHAEDLSTWAGEDVHPGWLKTLARVGELAGRPDIVERARRFSASLDVPTTSSRRAEPTPDPTQPKRGALPLLVAGVALAAMVVGGGLYLANRNEGGTVEGLNACAALAYEPNDIAAEAAAIRDAIAKSPECGYDAALAEAETRAWGAATAEDTALAYETFLAAYPEEATPKPTYAASAKKRLAALTLTPSAAAFAAIDQTNAEALRGFIAAFPDGAEATEAKGILGRVDQNAWNAAIAENSVAGYERYLMAFPASAKPPGQYADAAASRIKALSQPNPPRPGGVRPEVLPPDVALKAGVAERLRDAQILTRAPEAISGRARIRQTWTFDFDAQREGGDGADIWFEAETATARFISARGGQISALSPTALRYDACREARFGAPRIPVDAGTKGFFCVRTSEGRIASVRIDEGPGQSPGMLAISFNVWPKP